MGIFPQKIKIISRAYSTKTLLLPKIDIGLHPVGRERKALGAGPLPVLCWSWADDNSRHLPVLFWSYFRSYSGGGCKRLSIEKDKRYPVTDLDSQIDTFPAAWAIVPINVGLAPIKIIATCTSAAVAWSFDVPPLHVCEL